MDKARLGVVLSLVVPLLGGLAAMGCDSGGQTSEAAEAANDFVKVVNVEVLRLEPTDFTTFIRLTGEVEALNDVIVSAEESGVVEHFYIEKGRYVSKGAPLAKIQADVLESQVAEAAAAAQLAAERFERQRRLWEDEEIGSEIAFLEAKYQSQLHAARLATLEARLERTVIRSPISGVFDDRFVDAGEMVAPGTPVARVVEIDRVKVTGGVAERFAGSVQPGDEAVIRFEVLSDRSFFGAISFVGSAVDEANRTFTIEVVIDNPGRIIKPHMLASVEVVDERLEDVLVAPQSAVLRTENGYQVFVAEESGGALIAEAHAVKLGPLYANRVVIREGVEPGERLIVTGQQLVEAGNRVEVVGPAGFESQ
ncbi:MAG: efflux RND transporter periplasmic adaptor subunit [Gemmatimonadota bacterium]|nr:MAG: efflux RND transporter periplasmic adaptor subunit [Gemmatimonadota bacterium]